MPWIAVAVIVLAPQVTFRFAPVKFPSRNPPQTTHEVFVSWGLARSRC